MKTTHPASRTAIGIDVGGTKIAGFLVTDQGKVLKGVRVPTKPEEGSEAVLQRIASVAEKLSKNKEVPVGIAFPGFLDHGRLHACPHLPTLEGKPLLKLLAAHLPGRKVVLENDAKAFALAEHAWGAGKGTDHMIGLIIGTGIGAGVISEGVLLRGSRGGAGEIGHLAYLPGVEIEQHVAGPAILKRYHAHGGKGKIEKAFTGKDAAATKTTRETIEALGWLCESIIKIYDPERIILGGGVSKAPVIAPLNDYLRKKGITSCMVLRNNLGDSAGGLGAAILAFHAS
jgi:predicted NBD/HSP70 family sugar kinase